MNGTAAGQAAAQYQAKSERTPTLNDRLNRVSGEVQYQCDRLESVLAKALGHPTTANKLSGAITAAVPPVLPLSTIVEHFEAIVSRLQEIATKAEQIA